MEDICRDKTQQKPSRTLLEGPVGSDISQPQSELCAFHSFDFVGGLSSEQNKQVGVRDAQKSNQLASYLSSEKRNQIFSSPSVRESSDNGAHLLGNKRASLRVI